MEKKGTEITVETERVLVIRRRYRAVEPRLRRQRLYALLARRGFDGDTIEAALRPEADDSDERG